MNPETATMQGPPARQRLSSVDAYRGLVMFLMLGEALEFWRVARACPDSKFWHFLASQQTHSEWVGCSLHDLIQPSFSFLVGVALTFSVASRLARGESFAQMAWHAFGRAWVLILLGVLLRSVGESRLNWTFEDTLSQIGLGYFFLFLLAFRPARWQWMALAFILMAYWALFAFYPLPSADFNYAEVGAPKNWPHLMTGFEAHWNKNSNPAWAFDTWFMNLLPRASRFVANKGGYVTLSFIPTLGTMILGLIAGGALRSNRNAGGKVKWLVAAGIIGLLSGTALGWLGVCPVVKRIWTPSWVLFSGGWCFLFLAFFYGMIDVWNKRGWAFPLIVVGMNSIAAYSVANFIGNAVGENPAGHAGATAFDIFGKAYASLLEGGSYLMALWCLLFLMYRRKIFLRI